MIDEDIKIPKEYFNISNIAIYDTVRKLHGIIVGVKVRFSFITGYYIELESYFDKINNDIVIYADDFLTGKMKFVIITDYKSLMLTQEEQKDLEKSQLKAIKSFLKEKYTDDCIIWIDKEKRDAEMKEQEYRGQEKIGKDIEWAENATKAFILDNYSAMRVFELYKNGVITEYQFLIELVNILANEKRVKYDMDALKDAKVFEERMKAFLEDNKELVEKMIKNSENFNEYENKNSDN